MATGGEIDTDNLHDEIFDVLCSMCKNRGKKSEGEKFCVECHDYFCINCVTVHSQVPLCAGHRVLDKSQVKSGTIKGLPRAPADRCDRHSHKHIDMYCQNHDNVGCSTCMAIDHRSCKDIFYIPEFIQNKSYQVASREIQTKLKALAKTLAVQANNFQQDKQTLLKRKAELLDDIRKFRQEINDQLDKLQKSSIDEIENKFKLLEDKIEEGLKQLQEHKAKVTSANDKLACPNPNQAEMFVHVRLGEDAENVANKFIEDTKMKMTVSEIEFHSDRKLIERLKQNKTIGMLTEKTTKTADKLLHTTGGHSYCVKDKSDKTCQIYSACYMEDETIILADYNNNKLKRLDSHNYTITDCYNLPGQPYQLCKINETQVAVSLPFSQKVHFISVDRKMNTTNKIKTDFDCHGIAYANNDLYISDDTSVYIYTMTGRKLKQFNTDQSGHELFSDINSLAVSKDATRIYVTDGDNKGLIVLDNNGQIVTTYNGEQLQGANYCHLTEAGSVLVSGYQNVLQFTSDGELIGEVITADSGKPGILSVCCNQQMSKMCISRSGEDSIEVYDI